MAIKDIIFDLGNVLVPFDWNIAGRRLVKYLPPELARESEFDPKAFATTIIDLIEALEKGTMEFHEFFWKVVLKTGLTIEFNNFKLIWCDIFQIDQKMINLGKQLSGRYNVWLASNTNEAHYDFITTKFPEILFFKEAALSYRMGVKKPDLNYFVKALELFGISPENAIFVDDRLENVQAAEKIGIAGVVFTTFESLLVEFSRYNVITHIH
ncbi:MAG: HAD family hydrolase [Desulfomonilaceae bacterium]